MNERANIAGNVVLVTNLLLINTKLPPNLPYISLSTHTPQRQPAQTSGKQKDHWDLASILRAAPPSLAFFTAPSIAHARSPSSGTARCSLLLNSWKAQTERTDLFLHSKAFNTYRSPHQGGVLELFSSNKIKSLYIYRTEQYEDIS